MRPRILCYEAGCKAIGAGTCAIAAYDQDKIDDLLKVDGEEEFAIYLAPIGKVE
jgi:nitroreductase